MLWRRYRVGMIAAIPVGIAIGIGVGFLASRAYVGWGSSGTPFLVFGGVLGGIDAAAALVGTVVAMQLRIQSAGREAGRVGAAALGAGLGAFAPWIVIGVLLGTNGLLALFLSLMAAAVCGPVSAGLAALTVHAADRAVLA